MSIDFGDLQEARSDLESAKGDFADAKDAYESAIEDAISLMHDECANAGQDSLITSIEDTFSQAAENCTTDTSPIVDACRTQLTEDHGEDGWIAVDEIVQDGADYMDDYLQARIDAKAEVEDAKMEVADAGGEVGGDFGDGADFSEGDFLGEEAGAAAEDAIGEGIAADVLDAGLIELLAL